MIARIATTAAAAAASALILVPTAKADPHYDPKYGSEGDHSAWNLYNDVLGGTNIIITAGDMEDLAKRICAQRQQGVSSQELAQRLTKHGESSLWEATVVVDSSEWHYCPEYY